MSTPRLLARVLVGLFLAASGVVALVGGLYLRGPGLIGIVVSGSLVGCLAAGIARETPAAVRRRTPLDSAVSLGGASVLVLLVLCGTAILAGGAAAAGLSVVTVGAVVVAVVRHGKRASSFASTPVAAVFAPQRYEADVPPVPGLSTRALGREWLRTTALLAGSLAPQDRAALVLRRQQTLDELERRDPVGFGRWLAVGGPEADPADYVQGERTAGTDAA